MIVIAKLKAQKGKEAEVEKSLVEMVSKVSKEEGTIAYTLHRSQSDPTVFLFYEKYKDMAAFDYHKTTPYFQGLFAVIGPLLAEEAVIDTYDEIVGIR